MSVNGSPRKLDLDVARELGALAAQVAALKESTDRMHGAFERYAAKMDDKVDDIQKRLFWTQVRICGVIMFGVGLGIEGVKALL